MEALQATVAAYVAGAIDGEGHLGIHRNKRGSADARFTITNTAIEWLRQIQIDLGCGTVRGPYPNGARAKPATYLMFSKPEMRLVLPQLIPYLRLKRRNAELILQYFDHSRAHQVERTAIIDELLTRNRKGSVPLPPKVVLPRAFRKCSINTCLSRHFAKGYCRKHYKKHVEYAGAGWHERTCERCGKPFIAKRADKHFCSTHCGHMHWIETHRDANNAQRRAWRKQTGRTVHSLKSP